jgi:hypothetical protein
MADKRVPPEPGSPSRVTVPITQQAIQVDIMRALALFLLVVVLLWAVDEVAFDGRNGAQLYQEAHHQGQKLRAEVKNRLNTDKT